VCWIQVYGQSPDDIGRNEDPQQTSEFDPQLVGGRLGPPQVRRGQSSGEADLAQREKHVEIDRDRVQAATDGVRECCAVRMPWQEPAGDGDQQGQWARFQ